MSVAQAQTLTLALLLLWPVHNLVVAVVGLWATRAPSTRIRDQQPVSQFWLVIPALNEERVIARTVEAALALDRADTPARVLVVDDGSDDGTATELARITHPRLHVLRRELPNARRGKGEALNAAYRWIAERTPPDQVDTTVIGIIDGDGRISPGSLTTIAAFFSDPTIGAVQCQVRIHNRTRLLARLQDVEFGCIAHASQGLRDRLGSVGLGGNGQFTRLSTLHRFGPGPWSDCLVEDLELGLRLHLDGVRIRYASTVVVSQQGLVDARRLLRQRTRWAQGNLQCARHLTRLTGSREIGSIGLADFLQYLVAPWLTVPISALVLALAVATMAAFGAGYPIPGLVADHAAAVPALLTWGLVLFIPGLVWSVIYWARFRDEPLGRCLVTGLAYPGFLLLGVVATWQALARHLRRKTKWSKTERQLETTPAPCTTDLPTAALPVRHGPIQPTPLEEASVADAGRTARRSPQEPLAPGAVAETPTLRLRQPAGQASPPLDTSVTMAIPSQPTPHAQTVRLPARDAQTDFRQGRHRPADN